MPAALAAAAAATRRGGRRRGGDGTRRSVPHVCARCGGRARALRSLAPPPPGCRRRGGRGARRAAGARRAMALRRERAMRPASSLGFRLACRCRRGATRRGAAARAGAVQCRTRSSPRLAPLTLPRPPLPSASCPPASLACLRSSTPLPPHEIAASAVPAHTTRTNQVAALLEALAVTTRARGGGG